MGASRRIGARLLILLALGAGSEAALAGLTADCMGTVSVEYQRALGSGLVLTAAPEAVYLSTGIKYAEWKADDSDDFTGWGGGLLLRLRYLFRGECLTGFYLAAHGGLGLHDGIRVRRLGQVVRVAQGIARNHADRASLEQARHRLHVVACSGGTKP